MATQHPMVNIAVKAARKAGRLMTQAIDRLDTVEVSTKGPRDFVTEIDIAAEKTILHGLQQAYPNHSFLAEESGVIARDPDFQWVIDPLDGTKNFLHGVPHFAISIGLKIKGRIEHGVIYDPMKQELFTASRGQGAHLNQRRIRVSGQTKLEHSLLGTGFMPLRFPDKMDDYLQGFKALMMQASGIRRHGSIALDLAYVAAGRLDGFWSAGISEWDVAAGMLLVREAGGLIGDWAGGVDYLSHEQLVAGTPKIFKAMVQRLCA